DSLPDVFIQAYNELSRLLYSAALAVERRDIQQKTADLNRALTIIVHLQSALDFEQGGEVAATLDRFYRLVQRDIVKASAQLDAVLLRQAAAYVLEIEKIWGQALALSNPPQNAGAPPAPRSNRDDSPLPHGAAPQNPPASRWTA
ncbi:MAG: flagellar protein FliS, partial [Terriglobia bacterium]